MLGQNPSAPTRFQMVDMEGSIPADPKELIVYPALGLGFTAEVVSRYFAEGRGATQRRSGIGASDDASRGASRFERTGGLPRDPDAWGDALVLPAQLS